MRCVTNTSRQPVPKLSADTVQNKSVTNTNPTKNEDINLSLSYDKQSETTGGGWNVRGRDVSLPTVEGYLESPVAGTETEQAKPVNLPGLEKSQRLRQEAIEGLDQRMVRP